MFKNMKLGTKIGAGFGALIVILLLLGGLAVWNMTRVKAVSTNLVEKQVPEVAVANDVERSVRAAMFQVRGYAYTDDTKFLEDGRKELTKVMENLKKAKDLAGKQNIAVLKQGAEAAEAKALQYETMLNEHVVKTEAMAKNREGLNESAGKYTAACNAFLDSQDKQQTEEYKTATAVQTTTTTAGKVDWAAKLDERAWKKAITNEIIALGKDIRIGVLNAISLRDSKLLQEAQKKFAEVNQKLDELKVKTVQEVNLKQIEECRAAGKAYSEFVTGYLANWRDRDEITAKRTEVGNALAQDAIEMAQGGMDDTTKGASQAASLLSTASTTMVIGLIVALLLGILMAIFITLSITGPINKVIANLTQGSEQIASASGQVAQSSQSMAEGASEQASSLEEISSSLEEMSSMTKQNADNAKQTNTTAADARSGAEKGSVVMKRMASAIDKIKTSSDQTAKILKTIDEIAFQTNLLALNAAVEAARAGDAGKGFAVVAEEVRNLAMRSAEAAKNTAALIEDSQKNADNGVKVSVEVAEILSQIVAGSQKVTELSAEVSAGSNEQAQGIEQVNTAVAQMDKVTQSNAANAEESASASEELSAQARELNEMVATLVQIVNGSKASTGERLSASTSNKTMTRTVSHIVSPLHDHAPLKGNGQSWKQPRKAVSSHQGGSAAALEDRRPRPEEVIPLGDHDLEEF